MRTEMQGGRLRGSTFSLDKAVRLVMDLGGISFSEAPSLATYVPAQVMGWLSQKDFLQAGCDADLVLFDAHFQDKMSFAQGKLICQDES